MTTQLNNNSGNIAVFEDQNLSNMQHTINEEVLFSGVGVHSGKHATALVKPADAGSGIVFNRTDITDKNPFVEARYDQVIDTQLCTKIANNDGVAVSTIEHLMAALAGCGIDNAIIDIEGEEMPIMDGSSAPFVQKIIESGIKEQNEDRISMRILKPVEVVEGNAFARLIPADRFEMSFGIEFEEKAIGRQHKEMKLANGSFVEHLSRARTFGRLHEIEYLRKIGLARGGSLDNAIVVDGAKVLNPNGLRYSDEFVRHKMLDAVGDLALAGMPIIGRYEGERAGHDMTNKLLRALFANSDAWTYEIMSSNDIIVPGNLKSHAKRDTRQACA